MNSMTVLRAHTFVRLPCVRTEFSLHARRPKLFAPRFRCQSTDASKGSTTNAIKQERASGYISRVGSHLRTSLTLPMRVYSRWQARRPYVTQVVSSMLVYTIGDLTAQYIEFSGNSTNSPSHDDSRDTSSQQTLFQRLDPIRLVRTVSIGAIISIPSYKWMMFLSNNFNLASKPASVAYKILVNQFVYAPFIGAYFFSMQSLLSGQNIDSAFEHVIHTVPYTWANSWAFWPFVMAANFTFIQPQNRSIFAIGAATIWQTYLCFVNQQELERSTQGQAQGVLAKA